MSPLNLDFNARGYAEITPDILEKHFKDVSGWDVSDNGALTITLHARNPDAKTFADILLERIEGAKAVHVNTGTGTLNVKITRADNHDASSMLRQATRDLNVQSADLG